MTDINWKELLEGVTVEAQVSRCAARGQESLPCTVQLSPSPEAERD